MSSDLLNSSILDMDEALSGNRSRMEPGEKNNFTAEKLRAKTLDLINSETGKI